MARLDRPGRESRLRHAAAALALLACTALGRPAALAAQQSPRLLVLTDIGGDPDDMQSMRRLLLYANDIQIVGLIASASGIRNELDVAVTRPDLIHRIVDDFGAVRDNLARHAAGFPTADALRAVVRSGSAQRGVEHLAAGRGTEGSRHIVASVDADSRPLHVAIWGGAHDLAQALVDVRASRSPAEVEAFLARLRVYAIGDQDAPRRSGVEVPGEGTGEWIRRNFPELRYVQAGPPGEPSLAALFRGMYQNDSRGGAAPTIPLVRDDVAVLNQAGWVEENVRAGHGPLGAAYPIVAQNPPSSRNTRGVKEGDTPSWFFVLPNGLSDPERPEWGGWGGRFERVGFNQYFDAEDDHWSGDRDPGLRRKWTVARWREAYQNDFAARMDWTVLPVHAANHNPQALVNGAGGREALITVAAPGGNITLDAAGSSDPDGDRLTFRWFIYTEASGPGPVPAIERPESSSVTLVLPTDAGGREIHVVLEVVDDGAPRLTSYRRVVVRVAAEAPAPGSSSAQALP